MIDASRGWQSQEKQIPQLSAEYKPIHRNSLYAAILKERAAVTGRKYSSIAHCGRYCVCCAGDVPCGIDLEKIRQVSPEWIPAGFSRTSETFLHEWTALESYVKMKGLTLRECGSPGSIAPGASFFYAEVIPDFLLCVCLDMSVSVHQAKYSAVSR